jgi:chaperonin cofactor prefoldin
MKMIGGQKDELIDNFRNTQSKVDESIKTIEENCKKVRMTLKSMKNYLMALSRIKKHYIT